MTKTKTSKSVNELDTGIKDEIVTMYNNRFTKRKYKTQKEEEKEFQEKKLFMETLFDRKLTDIEFYNNRELSGNYKLTRRKMIMYGALWSK